MGTLRFHLGLAFFLLAAGIAAAQVEHPREVYGAATRAFAAGDIDASLVAYDRLASMDPAGMPQLWQRGIALYYAERWDDCIAQFEAHRRVNPHDVENSVWHYLCVAARDGGDEARAEFFPARDGRLPMMAVHALYAGNATPDDVFAAIDAADPDPRSRRVATFYAHLYLALWYESRGDAPKTLYHLKQALNGDPVGHYMETVAKVHLARLPKGSD